jgi:glutaredoxin 3
LQPVRIYTTPVCGYCIAAKRFLEKKAVPYAEIDVSEDDALRHWLVGTTGQRTVPQIFVGDRSIGGYTDMRALDQAGELDRLLGP